METISIHAINKVQQKTVIEVSFTTISRLTILNAASIKERLMNLVTNSGTVLFMNLKGLSFIDSSGFDTLNQLSRIARQYNSRITLVDVGPELLELIELVRRYSIFDIDEVIPQISTSKVA